MQNELIICTPYELGLFCYILKDQVRRYIYNL